MYSVSVTDTNFCKIIDSAAALEPGILANLVITEINYKGPESGTDTSEFIEFTNAGSTTIKMDGYNFSQGVTHAFGVDDSITAGQFCTCLRCGLEFRRLIKWMRRHYNCR